MKFSLTVKCLETNSKSVLFTYRPVCKSMNVLWVDSKAVGFTMTSYVTCIHSAKGVARLKKSIVKQYLLMGHQRGIQPLCKLYSTVCYHILFVIDCDLLTIWFFRELLSDENRNIRKITSACLLQNNLVSVFNGESPAIGMKQDVRRDTVCVLTVY